jgi:hypothetical protein
MQHPSNRVQKEGKLITYRELERSGFPLESSYPRNMPAFLSETIAQLTVDLKTFP